MGRWAGVQNVSRPMERCQEMSHITPTTALVAANTSAATYHGRPAPRGMARLDGMAATVTCLAVAGASRDEALTAPLLENLLGRLWRFSQGLLRAQPSRRRVREHRRQYDGAKKPRPGRIGTRWD